MEYKEILQVSPATNPQGIIPTTDTNSARRHLDSLFNDPAALEWLLYLTRTYAELFDRASHIALRLIPVERVCYLFDFDVIRNHLETHSIDNQDTFVVDYLFFRSDVEFGFPVGAFAELLDYLTSLTVLGRRVEGLRVQSLCQTDPHETMAKIAEVLGAAEAEEETDEFAEEISTRLEEHMIELTRLLRVLTNPRFLGIVADYNSEEYKVWLNLIKGVERRRLRGRPRTLVDERDAINLAITAKHSPQRSVKENGRAHAGELCYLLVSQTRAVLDLARTMEESDEYSTLADLLDVGPYILTEAYPVLHPREATVIELLGRSNDPPAAAWRAMSLREDFRRIGNYVDDQLLLAASDEPPELYEKALGSFVTEERDMVRSLLRRISHDMLTENTELRQIEEIRSTADSINLAHRRESGTTANYEDMLLKKSTGFLRLLSEVAEAVEILPNFGYEHRIAQPEGHIPYAQVEIIQLPEQTGVMPLISGELYSVDGHTERYYALRWPIFCFEEEFITAIKDALTIKEANVEKAAPKHRRKVALEPVERNDDLWRRGLIVSTSVGDYGLALEMACDGGDWSLLRLETLGSLIQKSVKVPDLPDRKNFVPEIQQLRVNTLFGDFVYDITPPEGFSRRSMTVLSHYNLSIQIAKFYEHTGSMFCTPVKLMNAVNEALKDFPLPSDA